MGLANTEIDKLLLAPELLLDNVKPHTHALKLREDLPYRENIIRCYLLNDCGDVVADIINPDNILTLGSGAARPEWDDNANGIELRMDGGDECKADASPVPNGNGSFSYIWFGTVDNDAAEYILCACAEGGTGAQHSSLIANNTANVGGISFWRNGIGATHTVAKFPQGHFFSAGVSCDGSSQDLYIDGSPDGSSSGTANTVSYGRHAIGGLYRGSSGPTPVGRLVGANSLVLIFNTKINGNAQSLYADLAFNIFEPVGTVALSLSAGAASAAVTGTVTASVDESDVVAGGKTLVITLTGDTWVAAGATFDAQRANILAGLDAATSPTNGWNNEVRDKEVVASVVRTSNTVVTITFSAAAAYDISAQETITVTVPNTALVTSTSDITGIPTFTVDPVVAGGTYYNALSMMGVG